MSISRFGPVLNNLRRVATAHSKLMVTSFSEKPTVFRHRPYIPYTYSTKPEGPQESSTPDSKLTMLFTCGKCETRAVKSFSKNAYEKGVVLVTCPGCSAQHVIADNLGWFGEEKNIEEILAKKGEEVKTITDIDLDYKPQ